MNHFILAAECAVRGNSSPGGIRPLSVCSVGDIEAVATAWQHHGALICLLLLCCFASTEQPARGRISGGQIFGITGADMSCFALFVTEAKWHTVQHGGG